MRANLSLLVFLLLGAVAAADTVRGVSSKLLSLEQRPEASPSLALRAEELLVISLPADARFYQAVLAEIVVSESLRRYADGFAVSVYSDLAARSEQGAAVFTGRRRLFQVLPPASRVFVRIPMAGSVSAQAMGPEPVLVSETLGPDRFPVLLALQPVAKGIPDSVLERPFFVSVRPEMLNRGLLEITLRRPAGLENEPVMVLLDGKVVDLGRPLEVEAGVHQVEVTGEAFQRETASCAVNPGQTTVVEIPLSAAASYLTLDVVEGAVVYLDGERLDLEPGERRRLTEGVHTIRFRLGENNVSRRIEVRKGKTYRVSLALELVVKEE